jgi:hypothetical protein
MLCSTPKAADGWSWWVGAMFGEAPTAVVAQAKEPAASGSTRRRRTLATTPDSCGGGSMTVGAREGEICGASTSLLFLTFTVAN